MSFLFRCTVGKHLARECGQENRKHRRLMKRAGQLDWEDLQEIAKMKGVDVLVTPSATPVDAEAMATESTAEGTSDEAENGAAASGEAVPGDAVRPGSSSCPGTPIAPASSPSGS